MENQYYNQDNSKYLDGNLIELCNYLLSQEHEPNSIKIDLNSEHIIGVAKIDLNKMSVSLNEKNRKINNSEKRILIEMLSNPGKTYSREEIGKISGISQERSIDVMITRLRQKLEINPKNPKYLQTVRGSGYVLWIE